MALVITPLRNGTLSFKIFMVEESSSQGNIRKGPTLILLEVFLSEISTKISGRNKWNPKELKVNE